MYKKLAASAARFHWGSKVRVGVHGKLDDIDREVYERRKTQRRSDLGDLIRAAGLTVDAASSWRVECLSAARSEFRRIPEKQYNAVLAAVAKLWRAPKVETEASCARITLRSLKTEENRYNERLRRFQANSYRVSFYIEGPSHVTVFRVVRQYGL